MRSDEEWMEQAIALAVREKGDDPASMPFGALVVRDGVAVAEGVNHAADGNDATGHAEIRALRAAGGVLGDMRLAGTTLYTTMQPCGMCTMATLWAGVSRIVYGAGKADVHAMYFECHAIDTHDILRDARNPAPELVGGVLADRCARLYYRPDDQPPEDQAGDD